MKTRVVVNKSVGNMVRCLTCTSIILHGGISPGPLHERLWIYGACTNMWDVGLW